MKKTFFILIVLCLGISMQAQHVFTKGMLKFNAGIGAPNQFGFIPTANFSGEVGVIPTGSVGLVAFGGMAEFHMADDGNMFPRFYVGPRATWHVHAFTSREFDAYAGAGFGLVISGNGLNHSGVGFSPDVFVGGRYMFSPGLGLFAEAGLSGLSFMKFGLTFGM